MADYRGNQHGALGTIVEPGTIRFERLLPGPVGRVWAFLTESDRRGKWLAWGAMDPSVGSDFELRFHHAGLSANQAPVPDKWKRIRGGHISRHRITRCEPPRILAFTWGDGVDGGPSEVTIELTPKDDKTLLVLTHRRLADRTAMVGTAGGWHSHLRMLMDRVAGVEPPAFWAVHGENDGLYERYFPDIGQMKTAPSVHFERILPGPVERVWEFLTDTTRLPGWFGNGTIEPRAGGAVRLMDGHIRGVVTQWEPPRLLAYSWNVFAPGQDTSDYPESYLSIALEPQGDDVVLTLVHLPVLERFEKQNAMGWHTYLDMLGAGVRGEPVEERPAYMKRNAALYGVDLANLAR
jgi:uncharacterized protein YndB with AHSA1/START domain